MTKIYYTKINSNLWLLLSFVFMSITQSKAQSVTNWQSIYDSPNANFYDIQKEFKKQEKKWIREDKRAKRRGEEVEEHSGYEVFKRWEAYMSPRVYPSGNLSLPSNTYGNFMEWQKAQPKDLQKKTRAGSWTALGPVGKPATPVGLGYRTGTGRINFIRMNPWDSTQIFVGTPDGGMWKTTNGGITWTTNNDFLSVIGCSDLAIDYNAGPFTPPTMYLATGDLEGDRRSIGILKSTDGGVTWTPTSLTWTVQDDWKISRLVMDMYDPLRMIVATNRGTFRTTDGWATYSAGAFPGLGTNLPDLKDLEMNFANPGMIFCSGTKLFKSVDSGATWVELTNGLPSSNIKRIAIATSSANPNYIYALYGKESDNSFLGLYRSLDNGINFTTQYTGPLNLLGYDANGLDQGTGQAFYDLCITISPANPNYLTISSINQWRSNDGGLSWNILSHWTGSGGNPTVHSDFHDIIFQPGSIYSILSGSDGGLFKSSNNGLTWSDLSGNINISQVNKIGISQSDPNLIMAGMQDNGTNFKSSTTWNNIFGGDGGESFIDFSNNNTVYYCYVKSETHRSDDGGVTDIQITNGLPNGGTEDFYSSFHQDPTVSTRLYAGGHAALYKSDNKGNNWTAMGTPQGTGNITEFAVAPSNNQIIYAVKQDAVSKSIDGGTTFTDITGTLPATTSAPVMVTVSNTNPLKAWVVFSGYSASDKVIKTTDGGVSWINVSTGLPNVPINTIVYVNNSNDEVYVGADIGVYKMDNTSSFTSFMTGLPNVAVKDLEIQYATSQLIAGTYGRGVWSTPITINTALPVTLHQFVGETINEVNNLHWTVSQELNLKNYNVQRSADGANFSTIGTVEAKGTYVEEDYHFTDTKPANGNNYYRLQMNDIDGKAKYSSTINLAIHKSTPSIYPNPASDNVVISMLNNTFGVIVRNATGLVVYKKENVSNQIQLDTKSFANGFYTIEISKTNGEITTEKISISH